VASSHFCPIAAELCQILKLPEAIAGVTIASIGTFTIIMKYQINVSGNATPDLISTYTAFSQGIPTLAIGELVGAASYTTLLLVGIISVMFPCYIPAKVVYRDITFLILALIITAICLYREKISYFESCSLIALYIIYCEFARAKI
jgi:sodium/potassium/calcium exchanger 6